MINTTYVKFHRLPDELKTAVTSPEAIEQIERLEQQYGIPLADMLIRLMVKEIALADVSGDLQRASHLEVQQADAVARDLQSTVLRAVLPYLAQPSAPPPIRPDMTRPAQQPAPITNPQQQRRVPQAPVAPAVPTSPVRAGGPPSNLPSVPLETAPPLKPAVPTIAMNGGARVQPARPSPAAQPPPLPSRPLSPVPPPAAKSFATFSLHAEDEQDIARHRDRLRSIESPSPTADLDAVSRRLAQQSGIRLNSDQASRLQTFILSRLRDVRSSNDLLELLTKPWESGGMGTTAPVAASILRLVDDEAAKVHDSQLARHLATDTTETPRPASTSSAASIPVMSVPSDIPLAPPQPSALPVPVAPSPPPPPILSKQAGGPPPFVPPPLSGTERPAPQPATFPTSTPSAPPLQPVIDRMVSRETNDRLIHDIKRPARPVSPSEELAALSPDDLRQMGQSFTESAGKILHHVQMLGEESYTRRAEGIASWRRSEVYQLYLSLGGESMAEARSVEDVIARRKMEGQPYLTSEEFSTVADLNRQMTL